MDWRIAIAFAVAIPFAAPACAADPSQFSVAETRLFVDDHLHDVPEAKTLEYIYAKRGSLEASIDDTARVTLGSRSGGGGRSVKVEYLSGTRRLELSEIDAAEGNPVLLYFLERDIREMHRLTGGSVNYYRKRIRMALAEGGRVETGTFDIGPRRVATIEIRISPYIDDPARSRYEKFAEKTYVFTLSNDVPGRILELRSQLLGPPGAPGTARETIIAETLRFSHEH